MNPRRLALALLVCALLPLRTASAAVLYVNKAATGTPADGSSWTNAFHGVQDALNAAHAGDEVWVAKGIYTGRFTLPAGVALYGGFVGGESSRAQRDWRANVTGLDAAKLGAVLSVATGAGPDTVLDGFRLANGSGYNDAGQYKGGGVYCSGASPTIRHNVFFRCFTSQFSGTTPVGFGGGLYCGEGSNPRATANIFFECSSNHGAAIYCASSSPVFVNNTVNTCYSYADFNSSQYTGALYIKGKASAPLFANNIVAYSTGFTNDTTDPGAPVIRYNDLYTVTQPFEGMPDQTGLNGNISANPGYRTAHMDFHIPPSSPCVNAGDDAAVQPGDTDWDGQARIQGAHVDLGADESDGTTPVIAKWIFHISPTGDDTNDGLSWASAMKTITAPDDPISVYGPQAPGDEVWVAAGTYDGGVLRPGINYFGGFAGTETAREQRDFTKNITLVQTRLSDSQQATSAPGCIIDGFTMRPATPGGSAGVTLFAQSSIVSNCVISECGTVMGAGKGGGLLVLSYNATIRNNVIENCGAAMGGGIGVAGAARVTIANNVIRNNTATSGGGLYVASGTVLLKDNLFTGNTAAGSGAALVVGSGSTIANNTFVGNTAAGLPGTTTPPTAGGTVVITVVSGSSVFANNIVAFNASGIGGPTNANPGTAFRNNCIYANGRFDFSGIVDQTGKNGNISADPHLASRTMANFHIQPDSPCVDTGDDTLVASGDADMDGQPRIQGLHVDMGADESDATVWPSSPAMIVRVKMGGDDAKDGSSWANAKATVQAAVNAASATGGEVWVAAGTYATKLQVGNGVFLYGGFVGNEAVRDARNPSANVTVLQGNGGMAVHFISATTGGLDGFTVTKGGMAYPFAGGVTIEGGSPVIAHNRIEENFGPGVSILAGNPTIADNIIRKQNTTGDGIGLYAALGTSPTIADNVIADNNASNGSGMTIAGAGLIVNNTVVGNQGNSGGGAAILASSIAPIFVNNIVAFNSGSGFSSGTSTPLTMRDNDVYGNKAGPYSGFSFTSDPNILTDPYLANVPGGDYRIQPDSPCVDAGDDSVVLPGFTAVDGQPRIQGAHVDIGAYESNGASVPSFAVRVKWDGDDANDGSTWALAKQTVQAAIDAVYQAGTGEVWVAAVSYYRGTVTLKPNVRLYGGFAGTETLRDQRDWKRNVTVLEGSGNSPLLSIVGWQGGVVDGFTIVHSGGSGLVAGGVYCSSSSPVLRHNRFISNQAANGGAINCANSSPTIEDNEFVGNAAGQGGAIYCSSNSAPLITGNAFRLNRMRGSGGAIYCVSSSPTITHNLFIGNGPDQARVAGSTTYGGAIALTGTSPAKVWANIFESNLATIGGAVSSTSAGPTFASNFFIANEADTGGAAMYITAGADVLGNTIVHNTSDTGAGLWVKDSYPRVYNNIIAYNSTGVRYDGSFQVTMQKNDVYQNAGYDYSNVDATDTTKNLSVDPKFAAPDYGNFHLQPGSPLVNAGVDYDTLGWTDTDIDGQSRHIGTEDIGADESDGTVWPATGVVYRVKTDGDDTADGASWSTAKQTVQAALDAAALTGGEVWAAAGHYPNGLTLPPNASLYGGFAGTETDRAARDIDANKTIIDAYFVGSALFVRGALGTAVDGLTLVNGRGTWVSERGALNWGAGGGLCVLDSDIRISRNNASGNQGSFGSGIYASGGAPVITMNRLTQNFATTQGGGIMAIGNVRIADNLITQNQAVYTSGIYAASGAAVVNNTLYGNTFVSLGVDKAALTVDPGAVTTPMLVANNIVASNSAGIYVKAGTAPLIRNNDVYQNAAFAYNGVPDLTGTDGNINADPVFASPDTGDFRLHLSSPCHDVGDDSAVLPGEMDADGHPRIQGAHVDMGAYEYTVAPTSVTLSTPLAASPATADGIVYVGGADGRLYAFRSWDLQPVAGFPVDISAAVGTNVSLNSRPAVYYGKTGKAIYLTTNLGHVVKVGPYGSVQWVSHPVNGLTLSTPAVTPDGKVFSNLGLGETNVLNFLFQMDETNGRPTYVSPYLGDSPASALADRSPAVDQRYAYVNASGTVMGGLAVLNQDNLTVRASFAPDEDALAPYIYGSSMFVATRGGSVYKVNSVTMNVDDAFGTLGRVKLGEPITAGPFLDRSGNVYVGTSTGKVWELDPVSGAKSLFYDSGTNTTTVGLVVTRAGVLAFGTANGTLQQVPLANTSAARDTGLAGPPAGGPVFDPVQNRFLVTTTNGQVMSVPSL